MNDNDEEALRVETYLSSASIREGVKTRLGVLLQLPTTSTPVTKSSSDFGNDALVDRIHQLRQQRLLITTPLNTPTGQPSNQPTMEPTQQPSAQPSNQPIGQPSSQPSKQPSGMKGTDLYNKNSALHSPPFSASFLLRGPSIMFSL